MEVRLELLTDPSDYVDTILDWHWREWSAYATDPSQEEWRQRLFERCNEARIPFSFAAFSDGQVIGYVAVCEEDLDPRFPDRGPWISGMYVLGGARNGGVGRALLAAAEAHAAALGITELWLHTGEASAFYERCGWNVVAPKETLAIDAVMNRTLGAE